MNVFHLGDWLLVFVATERAVLLSALACIRNDGPISFRIACAKVNLADKCTKSIHF